MLTQQAYEWAVSEFRRVFPQWAMEETRKSLKLGEMERRTTIFTNPAEDEEVFISMTVPASKG